MVISGHQEDRPRVAGRFGRTDRPLTPVGELFERVRQSRDWSYEEVSKRAGIGSPSTWGTLIYGGRDEKGGFRTVRVSSTTIAKYALALGIDVHTALQAAGYESLPDTITYHLVDVPSDQLWLELLRRGELIKAEKARITRKYKLERHAGT